MTDLITQIELEQKLSTYTGEDRVLPGNEVLEAYRKDRPLVDPYRSKLPSLDKIIDGFYPGQLIVVSGITGHGKTTMCQTFTMALAEQMAFPLWFSYEVACDDFLRVFPFDLPKYIYMPIKMQESGLQWIEDRIMEAKFKYDIKAVFVDHLHYLVSMNPKQNASFMIGETVRGLKQLALKHKIVMFLVAHMQKTKNDEEPGLGHIRDSSFVEQEADTVLYVWRAKDDRMVTVLKIAKNRKRGMIDEKIFMRLIAGRFEETVTYGER
jgi:replicative DNA helicase